jgi:hypothetical protein
MKPMVAVLIFSLSCFSAISAVAQTNSLAGKNPADELPPHIRQLTWFGERADWSHDGKRILFVEKTFGDVFEVEVATGRIRAMTHHFPHHGFTRALYLSNGDILLSGPETFNPRRPGDARVQCFLSVLDRSLTKPAVALGTKCSEGPAVSRRRLQIAWTHVSAQYPDRLTNGVSQMREAEIVYENGVPRLSGERLILDSRDLGFQCTMETQNYIAPDEKRLTFSAYGYQGTDVMVVDLETKKVTNLTDTPGQCDQQNKRGPNFVDIWKLRLDGGGYVGRLTFFSDYPGYKGSNPAISDDGRFMAFQMAKSRDAAGVGYGIFIFDLEQAPR